MYNFVSFILYLILRNCRRLFKDESLFDCFICVSGKGPLPAMGKTYIQMVMRVNATLLHFLGVHIAQYTDHILQLLHRVVSPTVHNWWWLVSTIQS